MARPYVCRMCEQPFVHLSRGAMPGWCPGCRKLRAMQRRKERDKLKADRPRSSNFANERDLIGLLGRRVTLYRWAVREAIALLEVGRSDSALRELRAVAATHPEGMQDRPPFVSEEPDDEVRLGET